MYRLVTGVALLFLTAAPTGSQWLKITLPGIPRTPDGKPNLTAPAPKMPDGRPDLSGIWRRDTPGVNYLVNLGAGGAEISMQPWAEALYQARQENLAKDRPSGRCLPHALPDAMMVSIFKITPTPGAMLILYEEFTHFRQIFTDGRGFPNQANPEERIGTWFGPSRSLSPLFPIPSSSRTSVTTKRTSLTWSESELTLLYVPMS